MTQQEWLIEFNKILLADFENCDDDLFAQISIIERYLSTFGRLPNEAETLHRINKAYRFYIEEVIPKIGQFPIEPTDKTN